MSNLLYFIFYKYYNKYNNNLIKASKVLNSKLILLEEKLIKPKVNLENQICINCYKKIKLEELIYNNICRDSYYHYKYFSKWYTISKNNNCLLCMNKLK